MRGCPVCPVRAIAARLLRGWRWQPGSVRPWSGCVARCAGRRAGRWERCAAAAALTRLLDVCSGAVHGRRLHVHGLQQWTPTVVVPEDRRTLAPRHVAMLPNRLPCCGCVARGLESTTLMANVERFPNARHAVLHAAHNGCNEIVTLYVQCNEVNTCNGAVGSPWPKPRKQDACYGYRSANPVTCTIV